MTNFAIQFLIKILIIKNWKKIRYTTGEDSLNKKIFQNVKNDLSYHGDDVKKNHFRELFQVS